MNDSVVVGDTLFLGGTFDYIGPPTGAFATTDTGDGTSIITPPPVVRDSVGAASDGASGWFIGSARYTMPKVLHVRADGSLDTDFVSPVFAGNTLGGTIRGVMISGGRLYVFGDFLAVNGVPRRGIVVLDPASGAVLPWDAQLDSSNSFFAGVTYVAHGAVDGNLLYIVGYFTTVAGQTRQGMAVLDGSTGALLPATFASTSGSNVFRLSAAGGRVYASGGCNPTPTTSSTVCAYDSDGTALPGWERSGSEYFGPILATPTRIYIAGTLLFPGFGNAETRVRGFDPVTGAPDGWATARISDLTFAGYGSVGTMASGSGQVFISGGFGMVGGVRRYYYAAFDTTSAALTSWQPAVSTSADGLATDGARVAITGAILSAGGRRAPYLTALDVRTGLPSSAALPSVSAPVNALASSGTLVVAGAGPEVVAFSAASGAERTRFDISADGAPVGHGEGTGHRGAAALRRRQLRGRARRTETPSRRDRHAHRPAHGVRSATGQSGITPARVERRAVCSGGLRERARLRPRRCGGVGHRNRRARSVQSASRRRRPTWRSSATASCWPVRSTGATVSGTAWVDRVSGALIPLGRPVPFHALGIARTGNTIVVGGNPSPGWRTAGLVALDGVTGAALPWAPLINSHILGAGIQHVQTTDTPSSSPASSTWSMALRRTTSPSSARAARRVRDR